MIYEEFVFFFQAEDGIRDYKVTGVQTCALPIFRASRGDTRGAVCEKCHARLANAMKVPREKDLKAWGATKVKRSEEHTSELQSPCNLVCRLLLEKKKKKIAPSLACIDNQRQMST